MITIEIRKTLNVYYLLCSLFFIFMLRPVILLNDPRIETAWKYATVLLSIVSVVVVLIRNIQTSSLKWIILFCISFIIGTFRNEYGNNISAISLAAQIMLAFNLGMIMAQERDKELLHIISNWISVAIFADSILGFMNIPSKLGYRSDYTLFGYDNYAAYIIFPLLIAKLALDYYLNHRWGASDYACIILSISYKLFTNSINAYFFFTLFFLLYLFFEHSDILIKLFDFRFVAIFSMLAVIGVVQFHIEDYIAGLLVSLGKTTNLSFRSFFWQKSVNQIPKTPLFGYGVYQSGFFQKLLGIRSFIYYSAFTHSHNFFIDLYFFCGIIGSVLYALIVTTSLNGFLLSRRKIGKSRKIAIVGVAIYYLMGFLDGYASANAIYFLFGLFGLFSKENLDEEII